MSTIDQSPTVFRANVEMYTRGYCGYCAQAARLLEHKGVDYVEYSLDAAPELRQEMMQRGGGYTVPQLFINGRSIGGCMELYALERDGELDELLAQPQDEA